MSYCLLIFRERTPRQYSRRTDGVKVACSSSLTLTTKMSSNQHHFDLMDWRWNFKHASSFFCTFPSLPGSFAYEGFGILFCWWVLTRKINLIKIVPQPAVAGKSGGREHEPPAFRARRVRCFGVDAPGCRFTSYFSFLEHHTETCIYSWETDTQ